MTQNDHDFEGDVGKGWLPIVTTLHEQLLRLDPEYQIHQVKEKFGGLRYYYGASENVSEITRAVMYQLVGYAEHLSYRTCETCGRPGQVRNDLGWVLTLCDGCYGDKVSRVRGDVHDEA